MLGVLRGDVRKGLVFWVGGSGERERGGERERERVVYFFLFRCVIRNKSKQNRR